MRIILLIMLFIASLSSAFPGRAGDLALDQLQAPTGNPRHVANEIDVRWPADLRAAVSPLETVTNSVPTMSSTISESLTPPYEDVQKRISLRRLLRESFNPSSLHVPISVVLFAIGLAGLIGLARRVTSGSREATPVEMPLLPPPGVKVPTRTRRRHEIADVSESHLVAK